MSFDRRGSLGVAAICVAALVMVATAGCARQTDARSTTKAAPVQPEDGLVDRGGGWATVAVAGPVEAGTHATASASCPQRRWVTAGGFVVERSDGEPPSPSIRVTAGIPRDVQDGGRATRWDVLGATGGQEEASGQTRAWVHCGEVAPSKWTIATADGPTDPASSKAVVARCPTGSVLLGGGAEVAMSDGSTVPRQYFLSGSFPSDRSGAVAAPGEAVDSWTAVGTLGGIPAEGGTVRAMALCGEGEPATVAVTREQGPSAPRTAQDVTASCKEGTIAVAGGALVGLGDGGPPPQGVHLRGSQPSDPTDSAASASPPGGWTATANTGGQVAVGVHTTAVALCRAPG